MVSKKFLLLLILVIGLESLTLESHNSGLTAQTTPLNCFYVPLGTIASSQDYTYTLTKQWTADQAQQIQRNTLNSSDFIHVSGWTAYEDGEKIQFFDRLHSVKEKELRSIPVTKKVLQGSDAPEFGLNDASLALAFGNPSDAKVRYVPQGKSMIVLRFQVKVSGAPYLGKWSVLLSIVDSEFQRQEFSKAKVLVSRLIKRTEVSALDVNRALNILPSFTENSIFYALNGSPLPAVGTAFPVENDAFLEIIQAGEEFLEGHIEDGYPKLVQVKDLVKNRSLCTR